MIIFELKTNHNMKYIKILILVLSYTCVNAQVGIGTTTPDPSSILDVTATDKGMLTPRISLTDITIAAPIITPAIGLLVYNTNAAVVGGNGEGFYYWNGTQWTQFIVSGNAWSTTGNTGTNPATNFLGTVDTRNLVFRTNNTENMRINTNGNIGIGTTSNLARLYTRIPSTDNTTNYGIYNFHDGTDPSATYSIYNRNNSSTNSTKYGLYNNVNNEGTGGRYGIYNATYMNSASNSNAYGDYNYLSAYGMGNHRANYNYLNLFGTVVSTNNYASYNLINISSSTNASTIYGEYTQVDYSAGPRYGEYKNMNSNASYNNSMYGDFNHLYGTGNSPSYAIYNHFENSGTGVKYGIRNEFADVPGTKYGTYNYYPNGTTTGVIYGNYTNILNDSNSTKNGTYNRISSNNGSLRGSYNYITSSASNTNTLYGVYSTVSSVGTGIHYGGYFNAYGNNNRSVYGTNTHTTGWAGYFVGNGYWDGNMVFNESGTINHDFRIESDTNENMFLLDANENLVRFGTNNAGSDYQNGSTISGTTVNYVADFDAGTGATGTAIGIGSIEYLLDGSANTFINNNFSPTTHIMNDLGVSTTANAWDDVYADNFINVSDEREKTHIKNLSYGLNEVLQMRTVSYALKKDPFQETKLGLIAQDVLKLIPEAVKTHDHKVLNENNPTHFTKVEMERMGMKYLQLIPVLIKATQEQQELIKLQNEKIKTLENNINNIKNN